MFRERLAADEEVALAHRARVGAAATRLLKISPKERRSALPDLPAHIRPHLTRGDNALLPHSRLVRLAADGASARNDLVEANIGLVYWTLANFGQGSRRTYLLDTDDLIASGNVALVVAVDNWDYTLGFKFSSYAVKCIRGAFYDTCAAHPQTPLHIPHYALIQWHRVRAAAETARHQRDKHQQSDAHVAEFLSDIEPSRLHALKQVPLRSWCVPSSKVEDSLADDADSVHEQVTRQITSDNIFDTMNQYLTVEEFDVLVVRLGLLDGDMHTISDTALVLEMTEHQVGLVVERALGKMRRFMHVWAEEVV